MQPPTALNTALAAGDTAAVIAETLAMDGATTVLDVGCGHGGLAKALTARGFQITGVDPGEAAIDAARAAAPEADFAVAPGEKLPFADRSFDAAVFLNSLHHVPEARMPDALGEAARVTRARGTVLVIEPLAEGPFFEGVRPIDDETAIRNAANRAVADAVRSGRFALRGNVVFERKERFADVDTFISRVVSVDPARAASIEARRGEVERLFETNATRQDGARILVQPLRIYWLRVPA
ncbi:class I SAM-dependent methyltransferase [Aurantimonas marianensis]|uniref:Class I SAM-dependent methyltransferase n=1 Tax=Aurantimonas marianensis TaxID=2920428 RepID=A0A9X2KDN4_9HYPH|nr:class I SAM-dependent methyltransferase [Aurantimonas marianensis]MCP3053576.1 class I SAM-dependent methyltransferase [Aurantimonas marianensis]